MDFIDKLLREFEIAYQNSRKQEFIVPNKGKERSAIGKLLKEYKRKDATSEQTIKDFRLLFESAMEIEDKFIKENISPSMILNQINKIRQILKVNNERVNQVRTALRIINLQ